MLVTQMPRFIEYRRRMEQRWGCSFTPGAKDANANAESHEAAPQEAMTRSDLIELPKLDPPKKNKNPDGGKSVDEDILVLEGQLIRALYTGSYNDVLRCVHRSPTTRWKRRVPRWDGGIVKGKHYESIWPQIAQFIRDNELPMFGFIDAKCRLFNRNPPEPDVLLSSVGTENLDRLFEQHAIGVALELQRGFRRLQSHQYTTERNGGTTETLARYVIGDRDISDLYGHSFAVHHGFEDLAKRSKWAAIRNYFARNRFAERTSMPEAYDLIWERFLPRGFSYNALDAFCQSSC